MASEAATQGAAEAKAAENKNRFPGQLDRYAAIKEIRQATSPDDVRFVGLCIAEELAGLSYILDGIRFNSRPQSR